MKETSGVLVRKMCIQSQAAEPMGRDLGVEGSSAGDNEGKERERQWRGGKGRKRVGGEGGEMGRREKMVGREGGRAGEGQERRGVGGRSCWKAEEGGREGEEERERGWRRERKRGGEAGRGREGEVLKTSLWSNQVLVAVYQLDRYPPASVGHKQMFKVQYNKLLISV